MDDLCQATNLSSLPVESRSILLKTFIREASLHARDSMFEDLPNGHTSRLLRLSSIARAVWQKDLKLYNILVNKSELARSHLVLVGDEPRILDPNVFEEQFREAKMIAQRDALLRLKLSTPMATVRLNSMMPGKLPGLTGTMFWTDHGIPRRLLCA